MKPAAFLILAGLVLASCGRFSDPQPAPLLSISDGRYAATVGASCITFEFGRRDSTSFSLDADCDGISDGAGGTLQIEDDVIRAGSAEMIVTAVGRDSFSGQWVEGDTETPTRFERVVPAAR